mmetsp:Transcript_113485/g.201212  ORF Transcript_113485/g.201212 Transcript_113485/m.201212 type:complete len:132 (+) Transcript_113485:87-482(+)
MNGQISQVTAILFEKGKHAVHLPLFLDIGGSSTKRKKATKLFYFDKVRILDDMPVSVSSSSSCSGSCRAVDGCGAGCGGGIHMDTDGHKAIFSCMQQRASIAGQQIGKEIISGFLSACSSNQPFVLMCSSM